MTKFALVVLALVPTLSFASPVTDKLDQIQKEHQICMDKEENQNTAGMNGCNSESYQKADALLNSSYKQIVRKLKEKTPDEEYAKVNAEALRRLVAAQRAWIPTLRLDCSLEGSSAIGGTLEGILISGCMYEKTAARVKFLDEAVGNNL